MALSLEATRVSGEFAACNLYRGPVFFQAEGPAGGCYDVAQACLDKGFFYVSNHGISLGLIDAVFKEDRTLL